MLDFFKENKFHFFDVCGKEESMWFCDYRTSALFQIDLNSNSYKMLYCFNKDSFRMGLYSGIALYEDKIILAPHEWNNQIAIYNTGEGSVEYVDILTPPNFSMYNLFRTIFVIGDIAYIIPARYPKVVKLNLVDMSVSYDLECCDVIKGACDGIDDLIPWTGFPTTSIDGILSIPSRSESKIMLVDVNKNETTLYKLGNDSGGIISSCKSGSTITYSKLGNNAINILTDDKKVIDLKNINLGNKGYWLDIVGKYIYAVPAKGNYIIKINTKTLYKQYVKYKDNLECSNSIAKNCCGKWFISDEQGRIIVFDTKKDIVKEVIGSNTEDVKLNEILDFNGMVIAENEVIDLIYFTKNII